MNLLDSTDHNDLEDGVRTMLRRIAADVRDVPPAWDDLIRRDDGVVVPLHAADPAIEDHGPRRRWQHRPLTSVAAAALVAAAVGGALMADGGGEQAATEMITAVSPGDPAFDASAAAAVWATGVDDPVAAATTYLAAMGVPTAPMAPAPATVSLRADGGPTATVRWSIPGVAGTSGGTVYLRRPPAGDAQRGWVVVGAAAPDVVLSAVAYDGERLSFSVDGSSDRGGELAVSVWVDGLPVPLEGTAVPAAGPGAVLLADLAGSGGGGALPAVDLPLGPDDVVVLRLVQVVDGGVRSLTEMALAMPEADATSPTAHVAGSVGAGGSPAVDAATDAAPGAAGPEAGGTVSGGASLPDGLPDVPDVTDPSLPVPTIPGDPTVTLPPVPTSLPVPPAGALP